jgi:hypothetical protein
MLSGIIWVTGGAGENHLRYGTENDGKILQTENFYRLPHQHSSPTQNRNFILTIILQYQLIFNL